MIRINEDKSNWKTPFFLFWSGQAFSMLGSSLVQFALVWWMTEQTGSATVLATGTFISLLPQVLLGPFSGALVDRWNRRKIMIVADASVAAATVLLAFLFWRGNIQLWHVFSLLFVRALGGTFHWSAIQASTSLMVPEKQLARVAGMNQTLNGVVTLAAPPLGALLLAALPMFAVLSIDVITALVAVTPLLFIMIPQPKSTPSDSTLDLKNVFKDVRIGFRYVLNWRGLFYILIMAAVINFLLAPINTYMPLLVTEHFQGGVWQVGWTETAWGSGVILGGVALGIWGGFKKKILTTLAGLAGLSFGVMIVAVAPAQAFWMALVGMGITGIMNPIINGPFMAIIQSNVEAEMQGRVFSLVGSMCGAMMPLSMVVSAPIVERFGPQSWYFVSAIICFGMAFGSFFIRELKEVEESGVNLKKAASIAALQNTAAD